MLSSFCFPPGPKGPGGLLVTLNYTDFYWAGYHDSGDIPLFIHNARLGSVRVRRLMLFIDFIPIPCDNQIETESVGGRVFGHRH